jgi:hypothetical protein
MKKPQISAYEPFNYDDMLSKAKYAFIYDRCGNQGASVRPRIVTHEDGDKCEGYELQIFGDGIAISGNFSMPKRITDMDTDVNGLVCRWIIDMGESGLIQDEVDWTKEGASQRIYFDRYGQTRSMCVRLHMILTELDEVTDLFLVLEGVLLPKVKYLHFRQNIKFRMTRKDRYFKIVNAKRILPVIESESSDILPVLLEIVEQNAGVAIASKKPFKEREDLTFFRNEVDKSVHFVTKKSDFVMLKY